MQTNRARYLTKGKQIQPVIFYRLYFSRFEKGKGELSFSDTVGDFLGTYGQFNLPQRTKNAITIREASCFTITAATLFARHKPLQLLTLWNVEGSLGRSRMELK
jgi:hypothetical protein